jgi:hypothetical protein
MTMMMMIDRGCVMVRRGFLMSVSFLMDDGLARRNRNLKESTSRARARGRSSTWRRFEERGLEVWVALSAGLR